jgi:hypothetical protein
MNNRRGGGLLASGDGSQKNRKIKQHRTTDRNRVAENRNWRKCGMPHLAIGFFFFVGINSKIAKVRYFPGEKLYT